MKNRVEIKAESRQFIRTGFISPLLVSAIFVAIQLAFSELSTWLDTGSFSLQQIMDLLEQGSLNTVAYSYLPSPIASFFSILMTLLIMVLTAGYYSYCMGIRKGWQMDFSSLLDGFGIAGSVIWCRILMGIKVFLWSLLFVIPGIIAAYRYRFAVYNLLSTDQPISASEAIAMSCKQTQGMKMDLFVLDLSFLGWEILSALTFGILNIWVLPYFTLSDLGYYEQAQMRVNSTDRTNNSPWEF
ncbi:MAG: DUF975 family protein [Oscillospiraceae bacterium]|nr:DUF975 family protein [Oscillospiraceae bacterium]